MLCVVYNDDEDNDDAVNYGWIDGSYMWMSYTANGNKSIYNYCKYFKFELSVKRMRSCVGDKSNVKLSWVCFTYISNMVEIIILWEIYSSLFLVLWGLEGFQLIYMWVELLWWKRVAFYCDMLKLQVHFLLSKNWLLDCLN